MKKSFFYNSSFKYHKFINFFLNVDLNTLYNVWKFLGSSFSGSDFMVFVKSWGYLTPNIDPNLDVFFSLDYISNK